MPRNLDIRHSYALGSNHVRVQHEPMSTPDKYTATRLRSNLYKVLDQVLETRRPVQIERKGQILQIEVVPTDNRLSLLRPHPEAVISDMESLVHIDWSSEWNP